MSITSPPFTVPAKNVQLTSETLDYPVDVSQNLTDEETITDVVVALTDLTNGDVITLGSDSVIVSSVIQQTVAGSLLTQNHTYLLKVTFSASATGETFSKLVLINCGGY